MIYWEEENLRVRVTNNYDKVYGTILYAQPGYDEPKSKHKNKTHTLYTLWTGVMACYLEKGNSIAL